MPAPKRRVNVFAPLEEGSWLSAERLAPASTVSATGRSRSVPVASSTAQRTTLRREIAESSQSEPLCEQANSNESETLPTLDTPRPVEALSTEDERAGSRPQAVQQMVEGNHTARGWSTAASPSPSESLLSSSAPGSPGSFPCSPASARSRSLRRLGSSENAHEAARRSLEEARARAGASPQLQTLGTQDEPDARAAKAGKRSFWGSFRRSSAAATPR